jgi:hypothetical protein
MAENPRWKPKHTVRRPRLCSPQTTSEIVASSSGRPTLTGFKEKPEANS